MDILWLGSRHGLNNTEQLAILFVLVAAFISLVYATWLRSTVLKKDKGTEKMQEVWNAIRVGADSYLGRQLKTILPVMAALTVVMFLSVYVVPPSAEAREEFAAFGEQGVSIYYRDRTHHCFYYGCVFFINCGSMGHAYGCASQCACCIRIPPQF